jgi:endonuclease III related protein
MIADELNEIYERLYSRYGPQHWWPGQSRCEIIVGAILTQNTNWKNVEKAIANLRAAAMLSPDALHNIEQGELAELIRPAGYYNLKAKRLKNFFEWLFENYDGDLDLPGSLSVSQLREELLGINGIGPETADSVILYGYEKPVFVVDSYTARVCGRHGLIGPEAGYDEISRMFSENLCENSQFFNEFHALLVKLAKEHCKRKPACKSCPLEDLPHEIEPI